MDKDTKEARMPGFLQKAWLPEENSEQLTDEQLAEIRKQTDKELEERLSNSMTIGEMLSSPAKPEVKKDDDDNEEDDDGKKTDDSQNDDDKKDQDEDKSTAGDDSKSGKDDDDGEGDASAGDQDGDQDDKDEGDSDGDSATPHPLKDFSYKSGIDEVSLYGEPEPEPPARDELREALEKESPLSAEEKKALDFWKFADSQEGYKGKYAEAIDFIRKHRTAVKKFQEEDPETELDQNQDYIDWLNKHKPKISSEDAIELRARRIVDERDAKNRAESSEEKLHEEKRTKLTNALVGFGDDMGRKFLAHGGETIVEITNAIREAPEGMTPEAHLIQEYPEQGRALLESFQEGTLLANHWLSYSLGLRNLDSNDPIDMRLLRKLQTYEQEFMNNDKFKDRQQREGKEFKQHLELLKLPVAERKKYWTFNTDMFLNTLAMELMFSLKDEVEKIDKNYKERFGLTPTEARKKLKSGSKQDKKEAKEKKQAPKKEEDTPPAQRPGEVSGTQGDKSKDDQPGSKFHSAIFPSWD